MQVRGIADLSRVQVITASSAGVARGATRSVLRRLSNLLLELYPLALGSPLGEFEPRLFTMLSPALDFDSGWVGRAALTAVGPVLHNSCLYGLPAAFAADYERAKLDDPIMKRLGAKFDLAVAASSDCLETPASFRRGIVDRYGLAQVLL